MQHQHDRYPAHDDEGSGSGRGRGRGAARRSPTGWWWSRMTLRLLSVVFSLAVIGFSAFYLTNWTIGPLIMMGPPAIVAILWDCVDAVCLCVFSERGGAHPIACVIVDLLLFLGLGAMSGVIAFTLSKLHDSGYYFAFFQDEAGEAYLRVVLGFGVLATISHLTIFVMACLQLKSRRTATHPHDGAGYQPHLAPLSSDPPPAYTLPPYQASADQEQDRITVPELATAVPSQPEKKQY